MALLLKAAVYPVFFFNREKLFFWCKNGMKILKKLVTKFLLRQVPRFTSYWLQLCIVVVIVMAIAVAIAIIRHSYSHSCSCSCVCSSYDNHGLNHDHN